MKTKNMLKYLKKICAPGMNLCHAAVQTYVFFSLLEVVEFDFYSCQTLFHFDSEERVVIVLYSKILPSLFFFLEVKPVCASKALFSLLLVSSSHISCQ